MERRLDEKDILAIYMDGIIVEQRYILAAIGVDNEGDKHLMGLASGSRENAEVVKDLLRDLSECGFPPTVSTCLSLMGRRRSARPVRPSSESAPMYSIAARTRCAMLLSGWPVKLPFTAE